MHGLTTTKKCSLFNIDWQHVPKVALRGLCMPEHSRVSFIQGWGTQQWFLVCVLQLMFVRTCAPIFAPLSHISLDTNNQKHINLYLVFNRCRRHSTNYHWVTVPRTWTTWMSLEDRLQCLMGLALASGCSNKFSKTRQFKFKQLLLQPCGMCI